MSRDLRSKPRKQPNTSTIERLLDAAERLFAEHGYDGVGIRQLADQAKVNLGAVTYHFGSKKALFIETFMRRFRPTNAERLRSLREAEALADGRPLSVEKIVECMIRSPFEAGLEYPVFHLFLARNLFKPPPFLHSAIQKELGPNVAAFIAALRRTLPELPEDLIHLRTMWATGVLLMFSARAGEIPGMGNRKIHEPLLREMVRFISAGLQSEIALHPDKRPRLPVRARPL
jgi:AcrR family transcriptional regulator